MPYVTQDIRKDLKDEIDDLLHKINNYPHEKRDGILNYTITTLLDKGIGTPKCYATYNKMVGVLECAKLELYRRKIGPYENEKIESNGDVYG